MHRFIRYKRAFTTLSTSLLSFAFVKYNTPIWKDSSIFLKNIYDELSHEIPMEEEKLFEKLKTEDDASASANTDDYIVRKMIEFCKIGENDVFLDLGSGLGKVVLQVAMETNCKEAIGIELSKTRVERANKVLEKLEPMGVKNVKFIEDTFLKEELWNGATIVFSWCLCFPELLPEMVKISKKVKTLKYIVLHDGTFEEHGINLDDYNLQKVYILKFGNDERLSIYKRVN